MKKKKLAYPISSVTITGGGLENGLLLTLKRKVPNNNNYKV
jgi:hypothetical protein